MTNTRAPQGCGKSGRLLIDLGERQHPVLDSDCCFIGSRGELQVKEADEIHRIDPPASAGNPCDRDT
jgi:hypothetical protein